MSDRRLWTLYRALPVCSRSTAPAANQLNSKPTSAISSVLEDTMTNAAQAFLLTAGLFGLSFFAIFAIWYAERLRHGTPQELPR
jgi:hypothetical protein